MKAKDLAKQLGVSTATISLVLNNKPGISSDLRNRLLEEIKNLGCESMLKNNSDIHNEDLHHKNVIVYAKYGFQDENADDDQSYFPSVLEGAEMQAREDGYNIQVIHLGKNRCSLKDCIDPKSTVGMIVQLKSLTESINKELNSVDLPYIFIDCYSYIHNVTSVCVNNEDGMHYAIKYLSELGHKNIGYIASGDDTNSLLERRRFYHMALHEFGLTDNEDFRFFTCGTSQEKASATLYEQWKNRDTMPTAFIAENDILAWRAIKALKRLGYSVPDDISIIGFDDRTIASMIDPPLTTIRVNRILLGRECVLQLNNLIRMCDAGFHNVPYKLNIGVSLIKRESVAPVRKNIK
jgi:DNA-binding LacI/PurR family transcriptional regulator